MKKNSKFSHLLTVRAERPNPPSLYGQPDSKISIFFDDSPNNSININYALLPSCYFFVLQCFEARWLHTRLNSTRYMKKKVLAWWFGMRQKLLEWSKVWSWEKVGEEGDIADISIYRVRKKTLNFEENLNWASFALVVDCCLSGFSVREAAKYYLPDFFHYGGVPPNSAKNKYFYSKNFF